MNLLDAIWVSADCDRTITQLRSDQDMWAVIEKIVLMQLCSLLWITSAGPALVVDLRYHKVFFKQIWFSDKSIVCGNQNSEYYLISPTSHQLINFEFSNWKVFHRL